MMKKTIKMTTDVIFKEFFKRNEQLCVDLLKQFIPPLVGRQIQAISYRDPFLTDKISEKNSVLDIYLQLDNRELVNIEMQCIFHRHFSERILYYWSRLFSSQLSRGDSYGKLYPTYSLIFTDCTLFKEFPDYYSVFSLRREKPPHVEFSSHLRVVIVELSKFKESDCKKLDKKGMWSYFIKNLGVLTTEELQRVSSKGDIMGIVVKKWAQLTEDESMEMLEEAREKMRRDREAEREYWQSEAVAEGIKSLKKGMQQGIKQGIKQGIEQGRQTAQQEIVKNMLKAGFDVVSISKVLPSFSQEEVLKIKQTL